MTLSEAAANLAAVLSAQLSGNQQAMNESLLALNEFRENPPFYAACLCELSSSVSIVEPVVRSSAIIELNKTITNSFYEWDEEFQVNIVGECVKIATTVTNLREINTIVCCLIFIFKVTGGCPGLDVVFQTANSALQLRLALEILRNWEHLQLEEFDISVFGNLALLSMQEEWAIRVIGVEILAYLIRLHPAVVEQCLPVLMQNAEESLDRDEMECHAFWSAFNLVLSVIDIPPEALEFLIALSEKVIAHPNVTVSVKLTTMASICSQLSGDEAPWGPFLMAALKLAVESMDRIVVEDLLTPLVDICGSVCNGIGAPVVFDALQKFAAEAAECACIVLLILSETQDYFSKMLRENWEWTGTLVSELFSVDNTFVQTTICAFLESLDNKFEHLLYSANLFLSGIVPLIGSPVIEVSVSARNATWSMVDMMTSPVPDLVSTIWSVNEQVSSEPDRYLKLVARCIKNEGINFTAQADAMAAFVIQCFESPDENVIIGALGLAGVLLLADESIHPVLAAPTVEVIFACLERDIRLVKTALEYITNLGELFREVFMDDSSKLELVKECLDDQPPWIIENAVLACAALMPGVPFIEDVLQILFQWIDANEHMEICSQALTMMAEHIPIEQLRFAVANICGNLAEREDDDDIIIDCMDFLTAVLSKIKDEEIWQNVIMLAGAIMSGTTPMTNGQAFDLDNIDISLVTALASVVSELVHVDGDSNRHFFQLAANMSANEDQDVVDAALAIFIEGVTANAFTEEEMQFICTFVLRLMDPSTPVNLIHQTACMIALLVKRDIMVQPELIEHAWACLGNWYAQISEIPSMDITLANIAVAIWTIAVKFGRLDDLVIASMNSFPPKGIGTDGCIDETQEMCELILAIASIPEFMSTDMKYLVAAGITKLLAIPMMMQKQVKLNGETTQAMGAVLRGICEGDERAQAIVAEETGAAPSRQERIAAVLGL